jgi:taurine dioxygenase
MMGYVLIITKATARAGAYIDGVDLSNPLCTEDQAKIEAAVFECGVVFLRDQKISPPELKSFANKFGQILFHPAYQEVSDASGVQILESTKSNPTKIEKWHADMTFSPTPPSLTILHGQIIPDVGGDTLWTNAAAAYEDLSDTYKDQLDCLVAVHDFKKGFQESLAEPGGYERLKDAIEENPPIEHPVVCRHPKTGTKILYVNELFTVGIKGLGPSESKHLLDILLNQIVKNEYQVRLSWEPNTIAVWDNRVVQHKPINDYFPKSRKMHRVTLRGDRPS